MTEIDELRAEIARLRQPQQAENDQRISSLEKRKKKLLKRVERQRKLMTSLKMELFKYKNPKRPGF